MGRVACLECAARWQGRASRLQAAFFSVRSLTAFRSIVELDRVGRGLSDPGNPDARRPASKKAPDFKQLPPKGRQCAARVGKIDQENERML